MEGSCTIPKITKDLSQDSRPPGQDMNPGPSEYKARMLTTGLYVLLHLQHKVNINSVHIIIQSEPMTDVSTEYPVSLEP